MGTARYTYNKALSMIKNDDEKINFMNLRNRIVPKKNVSEEEKWMLETPHPFS